jgi:hypothetical protein
MKKKVLLWSSLRNSHSTHITEQYPSCASATRSATPDGPRNEGAARLRCRRSQMMF